MFRITRNHRMNSAGLALVILISAILTACSGALGKVGAPTPTHITEVEKISSAAQNPYTVTIAAQGINITNGIPAGLVQLTFENIDRTKHSVTLYRLKDGVPISDFYALFNPNPRDTLSITEALGSYEIEGNQTFTGDFKLVTGIYIVVDDLANSARFASFQVRD